MSLYGKYIAEHRGDGIIERAEGFATYRYLNDGKSVYIVDIFVLGDFRKTKVASEMAYEIARFAKKQGAKEMIGTVVPSAKNSTDSIRVLLGYGMTLQSASNDLIIFRKEI